jgi:predicted enzyme related to lactoylglutathione lyase
MFGMKLLIIIVADIEKEYLRLKNLNVDFIKIPTKNDWGAIAIFEDTFGNCIQIHQSQYFF